MTQKLETKTLAVLDDTQLTTARVFTLIEGMAQAGINSPEAVAAVKEFVTLAERVDDRRARNEFNAAFAEFRRDCPPIPKDGEAREATDRGGKVLWRFPKLETVTRLCAPVLDRAGLYYGWSSEDTGESVRTTCTLSHVAGHSRSSTFTARKSEPNRLQAKVHCDEIALSIGQRRSLMSVLGIVAGDDVALPPSAVPTITDDQLNDLEQLFAQFTDPAEARARFCAAKGIEALGALAASDFAAARASIVKRIPT